MLRKIEGVCFVGAALSIQSLSFLNGRRWTGETVVIDLKSGRLETVFDKRTIKGSHSINIRDVVRTQRFRLLKMDGVNIRRESQMICPLRYSSTMVLARSNTILSLLNP